MLKLKTLKFSAIGRFVEEQTIDFEKYNNLIQVDGENTNTGGSSGSGKSTIFNAISHLFGLSDLPLSVLQSRLTKDHLSVSADLDWDGKAVTIKRAKKLSIVVDGVETTGSSKLTEELLDSILGIPRNLFVQLLHKRQNDSGFFLKMTPAQMNSFLTDCLGLSTIRSKIDSVDLKIKSLLPSKALYESDLVAAQSALEQVKLGIAALGEEPTCQTTSDIIEYRKRQYDNIQKELTAKEEHHSKERQELDNKKPVLKSAPFDKSNLNELNNILELLKNEIVYVNGKEKERQNEVSTRLSNLNSEHNKLLSQIKLEDNQKQSENKAKLSDLNNIIKSGKEAKEQAILTAVQIKTQRSGVCYTCHQPWIAEKAKAEESRLLGLLAEYQNKINEAEKANSDVISLQVDINNQTLETQSKIASLTKEFEDNTTLLKKEAEPVVPECIAGLQSKITDVLEQRKKEEQKEIAHNAIEHSVNKSMMESFFTEQQKLSDSHKQELTKINKELEEHRSAYEKSKSTLEAHEMALSRYKTSLETFKNNELSITYKIGDITGKVNALNEQLELAEETKRCLKSYLSCSFDDALDSISDSATGIVRSIPTMANATIRLEGLKETNAGVIKEVINACIDNDGEISVPIKSLSGGERSAVDLAIDLAVIEMIEERSGLGIDLILADEQFSGFDSTGVEQALDMLKTLNKRILIVEHNPIAKEYVNQRIVVVREGENSYIRA